MLRLPSGIDQKNLIDDLRIFGWEAAEILLYYSKVLKDSDFKKNILKTKNSDDPVTLADLEVNKLIIRRINEKYRNVDWEILSEENVKISNQSCDIKRDWIWVFDPLDGTKDFIQGTGNYAMHLALNYKKKPFLGIVLIPEKNELWFANDGKLWCERRNGTKVSFKMTKKNRLEEMVLVTSKNHGNQILKELIK